MADRFTRSRILLGDDGIRRLAEARVLVVGLGAVGSYATEALARSGIGNLLLIDGDNVAESNCNRQLYALSSTIGKPKADVALARVLDINPDCRAESRALFVNGENVGEVLAWKPDIVVDAIDSLDAKVELLAACVSAGIPVFSSMGAARKRNPSLISVADISKTSVCPLASAVRQRLRKMGVKTGITCVFSTEPAFPQKDTPAENDPNSLLSGKRPPLGSLPAITGIFGLNLAHAAMESLLEPFAVR